MLALKKPELLPLLKEVTAEFLEDNREWFRKYRGVETPCAWDINCGLCVDWVVEVQDLIAGFGGEAQEVWLEDLGYEEVSHCVLFFEGKYYDSQNQEGVADPKDLDVVRGVSRKEFMSR